MRISFDDKAILWQEQIFNKCPNCGTWYEVEGLIFDNQKKHNMSNKEFIQIVDKIAELKKAIETYEQITKDLFEMSEKLSGKVNEEIKSLDQRHKGAYRKIREIYDSIAAIFNNDGRDSR